MNHTDETQDEYAAEQIAVIGLSGRFPGASSTDALWQLLRAGRESVSRFTPEELEKSGVGDAARSDAYVPARGVLETPFHFDAAFFGMTPNEAKVTDPQQRVFLECAYEALEMAGYDPKNAPGSVGVYAGMSNNTYFPTAVARHPDLIATVGDLSVMMANEKDYIATRTAYKLDLKGPAINLYTACSTSLVAVAQAVSSLLSYQCDMALAGGASISFPQERGYLFSEGGILSPDGHCRAFDEGSRGTVFSSGVGVVALKRLSEAIADGDTIHAVIKSAALNNDGAGKVSFTAPSVNGHADVIALAHSLAGIDPRTISYVEAHGTGTSLGDPIEIAGLTQAFRAATPDTNFCAIGSVKTNLGHCDAAAGIAGLIKTILALKHKQIPASLHFETENPKLELAKSPFFVNTSLRDWTCESGPRRAGISSFGVGGTNAHVILEEAPALETRPAPDPNAPRLFLLSGRTPAALDSATENFGAHVQENPGIDPDDTSFTLALGRRAFPNRRFVVASSARDAAALLSELPNRRVFSGQIDSRRGARQIAFLFPGQGVQQVNMARPLYENEPVFHDAVDTCCEILNPILGFDLRDVFYPAPGGEAQSQTRLTETWITQPSLFVVEYALAQLWISRGVRPDRMLGHSVGEYVAACLAGVFSLEDGLSLLAARAKLMQDLPGGAMLAVRLPEEALVKRLPETLAIASINAPSLCVVSGPTDEIESFEQALSAEKIVAKRLATSHAFHSSMMDPILPAFVERLKRTSLSPPRIPYISSLTGREITADQATDPNYWADQLRGAVRFADGVASLLSVPDAIVLEVGPGQTLTALVRQHPDRTASQSLVGSLAAGGGARSDAEALCEATGQLWIAGAEIDFAACFASANRPLRRISLPTYPFEREEFKLEPDLRPILALPAAGRMADTGYGLNDDFRTVAAPEPAPVTGTFLGAPRLVLIDQEKDTMVVSASSAATETTVSLSVTPDSAPVAGESSGRHARLAEQLAGALSELSGLSRASLSGDANFLDMGFDSLFLTQAAQTLSSQFKVKVTFRQLIEDTATIDELAAFLDSQLPPEPAAAPIVPTPNAQRPIPAPPVAVGNTVALPAPIPTPSAPRPAPSAHPDSGPLERVISQQLELMARQLETLRGDSSPANLSPASSPDRSFFAKGGESDVSAVKFSPSLSEERTPRGGGQGGEVPPAPETQNPTPTQAFGPYKPLERGVGGALTDRQTASLSRLIDAYTKKTPGSKRLTGENRAHLSDPRAVAGFRQVWKEIVYPIVTEKSDGARVWDVDGNEYIDLTLGFGTNFLGHRPPFVIDALARQLDAGIEIGPQSPLAGIVAKKICDMTGMERAAFCNTGSEAVTAAIRTARTVTGRDRIAFFGGAYHGQFDEVLSRPINAGDELKTLPVAPGIPKSAVENVLILEYGTPESLEILRRHAHELAAVLVEPVQSRKPHLQPRDFVAEVREITRESGTALVFDEVVTGFRTHPGGMQARWGIRADMATYGKVVGGGIPIGILTGDAKYLDALDGGDWQFGDDSFPEVGVTFFAGTFVRHPLALASANAVLDHLLARGPGLQQSVDARMERMVDKINAFCEESSVPLRLARFSSMFYPSFPPELKLTGLLFYFLRLNGIHLWEGRPGFLSTAHTDDDVERVVAAFCESIEAMRRAGFLPEPPDGSGRRGSFDKRNLPLTEAQKEVWLASKMSDDASCALNESLAIELSGALDPDALEGALTDLLARHDALRLTFDPADGTPRLADSVDFRLTRRDLRGETDGARLAALRDSEGKTPFDLANGPLVRATLVQTDASAHTLILSAHHIVCDGASFGVLLRELGTIYSARVARQVPPLPLAPSFLDYAGRRAQTDESSTLEFWKGQLTPAPDALSLPTDRPHPPIRSYRGDRVSARIDSELFTSVRALGRRQGATLFTTLFAACSALISRLTGQTDFVIGVPSAGQSTSGAGDLVGHAVNVLPIRAIVEPGDSFPDHLKRVRGAVLDAFEFPSLTFGTLLPELGLPRVAGRVPLLDVTFNLDKDETITSFDRLDVRFEKNPRHFFQFDLGFNLVEKADCLVLEANFNRDIFDAETVGRWLGHFETLLRAAVANPTTSVATLEILRADERVAILDAWNQTGREFPQDKSIASLFAARASVSPDSIAIRSDSETWTYAELDARSESLARALVARNVGIGDPVAVFLERSPELIRALLAIAKAGAAYVPIDTSYPTERLRFLLADSGAKLVLTDSAHRDALRETDAEPFLVDTLSTEFSDRELPVVGGDALAYVMYTSGSTGTPKGTRIPHRAIARLVKNTDYVQIRPDDIFAQVANVAFDAATFEVWGALLNGASVAVLPREIALNPREFGAQLARRGVTTLFLTTALFNEIARETPDAFLSLRHVLFGGEAVRPQWVKKVVDAGPPQNLLHVYGPTEATTFATWHKIETVDSEISPIPIGKPIANTTAYVLDNALLPVPVGVAGELYLGGPGIALGYHNRPELTAERFVSDLFSSKPGARLYKTGDRVRFDTLGRIEFLGRFDNQVKVRGFRIEPGEIESALRENSAVVDAFVTIHESGDNDVRLIAYVVLAPETGETPPDLREFLSSRLPSYLVPSAFVGVDSFPLTPNGKIDARALPAPTASETASKIAGDAPGDEIEAALVEIWRETLSLDSVGIHDDFFVLGGHSLLAVRLFARIEAAFGQRLALSTLFLAPTIAAQAERLRPRMLSAPIPEQEKVIPLPAPIKAPDRSLTELSSLVPLRATGDRPTLYCVHHGYGDLMGYHQLVESLGNDQPVYGLQARGIMGEHEPLESIEAMAAHYVDEIVAHQPQGPYHLTGFSLGGVIAFEMARQLRARNARVGIVALLDTYAPIFFQNQEKNEGRGFLAELVNAATALKNLSPDERWNFTRHKGRAAQHRLKGLLQRALPGDASEEEIRLREAIHRVEVASRKALREYTPGLYDGNVVIFHAREREATTDYDPVLWWRKVIEGELDIREIPGDHHAMIQKPGVDLVARLLRDQVQNAWPLAA